jgi:hypothetical protein
MLTPVCLVRLERPLPIGLGGSVSRFEVTEYLTMKTVLLAIAAALVAVVFAVPTAVSAADPATGPAPVPATVPAAAAPAATATAPCGVCDSCGSCGGRYCCCCCEPVWTAHADALFLHRSTPRDVLLVADADGLPLLSAGEFDFAYDAGWQIGLTRRLSRCWSLEGNYFKVDSWNATAAPVVSATGTFTQYIDPIGSELPTEMTSSYRSELESVELNARHSISPSLDVIFGFRFIELDDGNLALVGDRGGQMPYISTHSIKANNCLYGFQIGGDAKLLSWARFDLGTVIKAGVYGNSAHNAVLIADPDPHFACNAEGGHAAFAGEVDVTLTYQLTRNLLVEAAYQLLWLEGVACASDQVGVSDPYTGTGGITFNGSPFYNGASVGLVLRR